MSPPTSPASASADDIAKWQQERLEYQAELESQRSFRDTVFQFIARTDTSFDDLREDQTELRKDLQQHSADDLRQLRKIRRKVNSLSGQVTQTVTSSRYNWGVALAWVSAFVAVAGAGWAFIKTFGGVIKP